MVCAQIVIRGSEISFYWDALVNIKPLNSDLNNCAQNCHKR